MESQNRCASAKPQDVHSNGDQRDRQRSRTRPSLCPNCASGANCESKRTTHYHCHYNDVSDYQFKSAALPRHDAQIADESLQTYQHTKPPNAVKRPVSGATIFPPLPITFNPSFTMVCLRKPRSKAPLSRKMDSVLACNDMIWTNKSVRLSHLLFRP